MTNYKDNYKELKKAIKDINHETYFILLDEIFDEIKKGNIPFNNMNIFKEIFIYCVRNKCDRTFMKEIFSSYNNKNNNCYIFNNDLLTIEICKRLVDVSKTAKVFSDGIKIFERTSNKQLFLSFLMYCISYQVIRYNALDLELFNEIKVFFSDESSYFAYCIELIQNHFVYGKKCNKTDIVVQDLLINKMFVDKQDEIKSILNNEELITKYMDKDRIYDIKNINKFNSDLQNYLISYVNHNYGNFEDIEKSINEDLIDNYQWILLDRDNILSHNQFSVVLDNIICQNNMIVSTKIGDGFDDVINSINKYFKIPIYNLNHSSGLSQYKDFLNNVPLITDIYQKGGIILIEVYESDIFDYIPEVYINNIIEDFDKVLKNIPDIIKKHNYFNIIIKFTCNDKVYEFDESDLNMEYDYIEFNRDFDLEKKIIINEELYKVLDDIICASYNFTLKDINNIVKYYKTGLYEIEEVLSIVLNKREIRHEEEYRKYIKSIENKYLRR